jgi:hypothetical protein
MDDIKVLSALQVVVAAEKEKTAEKLADNLMTKMGGSDGDDSDNGDGGGPADTSRDENKKSGGDGNGAVSRVAEKLQRAARDHEHSFPRRSVAMLRPHELPMRWSSLLCCFIAPFPLFFFSAFVIMQLVAE